MGVKNRNAHADYRLVGVFASAAAYLSDNQKSAASAGDIYYDTTLSQLRVYDGGSWTNAGDTSTSAGSLDDAAQVGAKITNTQAIEIEASASSSNLLILDANGTTNVDIFDVSSAGGTGDLINLTQAGTGMDIRGTSDTWRVSKAGALTLDGASAALTVGDDTPINIGGSNDITIEWDQTRLQIDGAAADTEIYIGAANNLDLVIYGDSTNDSVVFDTSAELMSLDGFDLLLQDDDVLNFGDSSDVTIAWDQTRLNVDAAAADTVVRIGHTNNLDLVVYGDTTTDAITFDTSAEDVQFNGFDLTLQDDDILNFGDSDDVAIYWDQTKLNIIPVADDTVLQLGAAATAFDVTWQSGTSGDYITFDASTNRVEVVDVDIRLDDAAKLLLGSSADGSSTDGTLYWDQTNLQLSAGGANLQINDDVVIGEAGSNENLTVNGNLTVTGNLDLTGGLDVGSQTLSDSETLTFGTDSDVVVQWDGSNLKFEAASDNAGQIWIGETNAIDFRIYGSTNTKEILFDVSTAKVEVEDWDISIHDDDVLMFGDSDDITVQWDQTSLAIDGAAQANQIDFGKSTEVDIVLHGVTGKDFYWDCTNSQGIVKDDATLAFGNASDVTIAWDQTR
ncbi:MAG: autotransporter outer membrane beta-barrel domain-containing protein, partial [Planctomycetota bacterium]